MLYLREKNSLVVLYPSPIIFRRTSSFEIWVDAVEVQTSCHMLCCVLEFDISLPMQATMFSRDASKV